MTYKGKHSDQMRDVSQVSKGKLDSREVESPGGKTHSRASKSWLSSFQISPSNESKKTESTKLKPLPIVDRNGETIKDTEENFTKALEICAKKAMDQASGEMTKEEAAELDKLLRKMTELVALFHSTDLKETKQVQYQDGTVKDVERIIDFSDKKKLLEIFNKNKRLYKDAKTREFFVKNCVEEFFRVKFSGLHEEPMDYHVGKMKQTEYTQTKENFKKLYTPIIEELANQLWVEGIPQEPEVKQ